MIYGRERGAIRCPAPLRSRPVLTDRETETREKDFTENSNTNVAVLWSLVYATDQYLFSIVSLNSCRHGFSFLFSAF